MDFLDIDNYDNLLQIARINKDIQILTNEINDFEKKKKSNIHFLNIQRDFFNDTILRKTNILKKYNFKIIQNILFLHNLKLKNVELNATIDTYNNDIIHTQYNMTHFSIDSYSDINKSFEKSLSKINLLYKQSNFVKFDFNINTDTKTNLKFKQLLSLDTKYLYILFNYITKFNLFSDIQCINLFNVNIYQHLILKLKLNVEIKCYLKFKKNSIKNISKYQNSIIKSKSIIEKNNKQINLLYKKIKNFKNKFIYTFKDLKMQESNNIKLQTTMNTNICELDIRIDIKQKMLQNYKNEIENYNNAISILNETKGHKINANDVCSICLENINLGITTDCKHHFHYGCINSYIFNVIQNSSKLEFMCPICRRHI